MAERKIFAGGRLKRLRQRLGLSQTQMANEIGVSPSYLNLIERDQRPLTVQVLLKLSAAYSIDVTELSDADSAGTVEALREVFSDPLLLGEVASPSELSDFADAAPNAAHGMMRLFEAYREALERLSELSQSIASQGAAPAETALRDPLHQAAAYFEEHGPWFPSIEETAEGLADTLAPHDDPADALKAHLQERFRVDLRILPAHVMPVEQLRYDRHSLRLFMSERVPLIERPFLLARQIVLLGHASLIDRLTKEAELRDPEAMRICRAGFARRLAEAILAPRRALAATVAGEAEPDIMRLSQHFTLKPSRIITRLATLGAGGVDGVLPAFAIVLDASGNVLTRVPGAGFPFPRFAPFCARLPVFDGLTPGRPVSCDLVLADNNAFHCVALAEDGPADPGLPAPRRLALIGWREAEGARARNSDVRPIGVTCRLCDRSDCAYRLQPPVAQTTSYLDHAIGPADYELAG